MDVIAQWVLSSVVWGPMVVILYWIIRLAVRHGVQDAHRANRIDDATAALRGTIRRQQATHGGAAPE